ncbi:MAG: 30S ribosomal protein S12 methylthiotransferase RimO [Anaerolineae bacterium]|nr:30S ribosomal protein S12 methylthiotransferase RimO [Anaerolineae bacterium]
MPRFYLITLGCPKNVVDSEGIHRQMVAAGFEPTDRPRRADVLIVNTCGFIGDALDESLATLGELASAKRQGQVLIAAGCLSEREGEALFAKVKGVDAILGTRRWAEIARLVAQARTARERIAWTGDPADPESGPWCLDAPMPRVPGQASAYLKVADGCSATCAFCTIPSIKGPYRSRRVGAILAEAKALADSGARELILIAQDTTSYGRDIGGEGLPGLLRALSGELPHVPWIRVMYAYPQFVTPELIEAMAQLPNVCHYLDMPLQHAHPDVLKRMRRPSDMDAVRRLLESLRAAMPDIALRTTFIVGYPGETDAQFQTLLDFMAEARFDHVGVFRYSREPGTPAADLPSQIPEDIKQARYKQAMALQQEISRARNLALVGRVMDVLVDGAGDGISVGRTYRDAPEIDGLVPVPGELPVGSFVRVRITGAMEYDLLGEVVG